MSGKENYEFNEKNQTEQQKVFQEIRQNTKHLENEINKELTETEFNNLQMRQEKEQLTDKEYEKMLQYMDKHTTNMILYIRRISPNLKKKIEDFTQEHQFPNLTLKIDLKNFKNKEQLPKVKYLSFLCDCNYPELTEQSFKEIHEQVNYVLKNHSSFVSCLLTTDNITLEQANKCYQLAYIEGISVKNSVSADTARVLCKFKNTHFNSPELQHEEDYFIKNTMQSYLLTKKQNNPKLDRDSVRFGEKKENIIIEKNNIIIDTRGENVKNRTTYETLTNTMTTRFHGKDYVLPITFSPLKREQSLIIEQSNENIKKLQAITEIANLINRFKTNFVLPPDEKAIRYDKDKGFFIAIQGFERFSKSILSKEATDRLLATCKSAGIEFNPNDIASLLNRMKYEHGGLGVRSLAAQVNKPDAIEIAIPKWEERDKEITTTNEL